MFNCAALASQIASEQNLDNDEGLKTAAKQYQVCRKQFLHRDACWVPGVVAFR